MASPYTEADDENTNRRTSAARQAWKTLKLPRMLTSKAAWGYS